MNPNFLNLFMKKLTRDRVVPTISDMPKEWEQAYEKQLEDEGNGLHQRIELP